MAKLSEEWQNRYFSFLTDQGYVYEYLIEKSSDRSGVMIHRFRRGKQFYDFRTVSDGKERNFVSFDGAYHFPNLEKKHKDIARAFFLRHVFRKPTQEELWEYAADLLKAEIGTRDESGAAIER